MQDRFSVYDVFAVLVPGVIFMYLLAFTLDRAVGVKLFDWTGSVGDAALLFVFGYAAIRWRYVSGHQGRMLLICELIMRH